MFQIIGETTLDKDAYDFWQTTDFFQTLNFTRDNDIFIQNTLFI